MDDPSVRVVTQASTLLPMFEWFRTELDTHHDRRERVIKASRDITAASKKIIFTLQRLHKIKKDLSSNVVAANKPYYGTIMSQMATISSDIQNINAYRYAKNISGGHQEYIEAVSFEHYLASGGLLNYEAAVAKFKRSDLQEPGPYLSPEDYILGIYDMTGELMRFAITNMAASGKLPEICTDEHSSSRNILSDLHVLRSSLESLNAGTGPFAKDVQKKEEVMQMSVEKVEKAVYGLVVRGAERPKGWMPDLSGSTEGSTGFDNDI